MAIVHETVLGTITWNRRNNQPCTRGGRGINPGRLDVLATTPPPPPLERTALRWQRGGNVVLGMDDLTQQSTLHLGGRGCCRGENKGRRRRRRRQGALRDSRLCRKAQEETGYPGSRK